MDIVENIIDEIGLFGLEASLNEVGIGDQSWFDSVLLHDFNDTHSLMNLSSSSIDLKGIIRDELICFKRNKVHTYNHMLNFIFDFP